MSTVFSPTPFSVGLGTSSADTGTDRGTYRIPRRFDGSRGLAAMLLAAATLAHADDHGRRVAPNPSYVKECSDCHVAFPVQMPPPPGRSAGYPLQIAIDGGLYGFTLLAMVVLAGIASALVARRTVAMPVVDALAHV